MYIIVISVPWFVRLFVELMHEPERVEVDNRVKTSYTTISVDLAHYVILHAKIEKGRINRGNRIHHLVSSVDWTCVFIRFIFKIHFYEIQQRQCLDTICGTLEEYKRILIAEC